jgi:hypothetical protein
MELGYSLSEQKAAQSSRQSLLRSQEKQRDHDSSMLKLLATLYQRDLHLHAKFTSIN